MQLDTKWDLLSATRKTYERDFTCAGARQQTENNRLTKGPAQGAGSGGSID